MPTRYYYKKHILRNSNIHEQTRICTLCSSINAQLPKMITWEQVPLQKNALKHGGFSEEEQMPKCNTHNHQPKKKKLYKPRSLHQRNIVKLLLFLNYLRSKEICRSYHILSSSVSAHLEFCFSRHWGRLKV